MIIDNFSLTGIAETQIISDEYIPGFEGSQNTKGVSLTINLIY